MSDSSSDFDSLDDYLRSVFKRTYRRLLNRVTRWTQAAAPLNPDDYPKGNTLTVKRWEVSRRLYPYLHVPREKCEAIEQRLLSQIPFMEGAPSLSPSLYNELAAQHKDTEQRAICPATGEAITIDDVRNSLGHTSRIGNLEINMGFAGPPERGEPLSLENLSWIKPPYYLYELRAVFSRYRRLLSKVQTKAYLTDRRQTGDYPTKREARWEAHPNSPQFAPRRECVRIEAKLLAQILDFSGAPHIVLQNDIRAEIEGLLEGAIKSGTFRCPISGQSIDYKDLVQVAETPVHGRSNYQAAHLVPLAMENGYHTAENICWITELGNRVQGEDALDDIVDQIFRMATYHKERLRLSWDEIEKRP